MKDGNLPNLGMSFFNCFSLVLLLDLCHDVNLSIEQSRLVYGWVDGMVTLYQVYARRRTCAHVFTRCSMTNRSMISWIRAYLDSVKYLFSQLLLDSQVFKALITTPPSRPSVSEPLNDDEDYDRGNIRHNLLG